MTPQEFSIFVANGAVIPILFIILIATIVRRDRKRDRLDEKRGLEAVQREAALRREKEVADTRLIKELKATQEAAESREDMLRNESTKREKLLKEEAAKREAILMAGFSELTNAMHNIANEINFVKNTVQDLQNNQEIKEA